eukprot:7827757-Alexandrium_andersonii.AAC.1
MMAGRHSSGSSENRNSDDGYELGEQVFYRARPSDMDGSLSARWEHGVWLGCRWGTASHIAAVSPREVRE